MTVILSDLLNLKIPEGQTKEEIRELNEALKILGPEYGNVYSAKGFKGSNYSFTNYSELKNYLTSLGFPKDTPDKYYEIILSNWYENTTSVQEYSKETITEAPRPEGLNQTTISEKSKPEIFEEAERRSQSEAKSREDAKRDVKNFQDRLDEINKAQKKIQDDIKKAKEDLPKLKDKKVYASVEEEPLVIKPEVQKTIETLISFAVNEETRTNLIDDLSIEIEKKSEMPPEVARTVAVQLINDISSPEQTREVLREAAIQKAIAEDKQGVLDKVLGGEKELIELAKKGAVLQSVDTNDSIYLSRTVAENLFGKEVAEAIYGRENIKVVLSSESANGTTHALDLEKSNQNFIKSLEEKDSIINSAREFGIDRTKSIFTNNVKSYLAKKAVSAPEGSLLKNTYSSEAVRAILNKGLPEYMEWKAYNGFGEAILKYNPEYAPYFKLFSEVTGVSVGIGAASKIVPLTFGQGAIPLAKIAYIQPIKSLGVPYTLGIKTGSKIAISTGAKAAEQAAVKAGVSATLSSTLAAAGASIPVPILNAALAAAGWLIGEAISKLKEWWTKNKDKIGPFLAVGAGLGGAMFFGAGPGIAIGLGVGAATMGVGTIVGGAVSLLGFIGSSIGVTIATPVIVTLLALPPLIAFIMLVINNSAYVVPPSSLSSSIGADNPYMLVTKTAIPSKIGNAQGGSTVQVSYTVSIKALKENLTNVKVISSKCNVVTKDRSVACPKENIPELASDFTVSPTSTHTFTFTGEYNSNYNDSLIFDSVTISATTSKGESITTSGSATVCIGDCPTDCVKVADLAQKWPGNLKSNSESALGILSGEYQGFMAKVCSNNETINICYSPKDISPGYYAWHVANAYKDNCDVYFNEKGLQSENDALFLITHELSHHVQSIYGGWKNEYENSGAWSEISSGGFCTYKDTKGSETESMAEANGLFAAIPSWGSCAANYRNLYPRNFMFAEKFMK
jgi:hypothetical protein